MTENIVNDSQENYKTGWISLYRSILNNDFWLSEKFTRGQAWVDLLLLAKYKEGFFYKRDVMVNYKRGDITEGIINLAKRWMWSRNKTQKFINDLEKEQQVKQHKSHVITIITVVNYDEYQVKRTTDETTEGQQEDTHNKVNKDNNSYSESDFLKDWKKVRENKTNQTTNINKLTQYELNDFNTLKKEFTKQQFQDAMLGLFEQKNMFPANKLRPTHFLRDRNIEKYLDCKTNNKQLFEEKQMKL